MVCCAFAFAVINTRMPVLACGKCWNGGTEGVLIERKKQASVIEFPGPVIDSRRAPVDAILAANLHLT
jgi:hypothetical protein